MNKYLRVIAALSTAALLTSCANIGNPSGGARDEEPPRLVRANPGMGALNVTKPEITLTFNELVNVKDAFDNVVVSPAGRPPRVTTLGRRINIRFDSLAPNTTYTVDFADAIEDNNEGNKLQNFAYTFSTGPSIDSLRVSGRVLGARDLEPRPGILVGVTDNTTDTVFLRTPLLRVAKTDDRGRFIVRGLAPGVYRVFALGDKNSDFIYSSDDEEVAFYDVPVSPATETVTALDTVYNPVTGTVDSVIERPRTRYLPNDILLRTFISDRKQQYIAKYERPDSARLFLKMNAPSATLPPLRILGHESSFPGIVESRPELDSLTIWLPPAIAALDTIRMTVAYTRNEWNKEPEETIDTISFIRKRMPQPKKPKKQTARQAALDSLAQLTTAFIFQSVPAPEVWQPVYLESAAPLVRLDTAAIHLEVLKDTVWTRTPLPPRIFQPDSVAPRRFALDYDWDYETRYRIVADTLAGTDLYGRTTLPLTAEFAMRPAGDYCTLSLDINGLQPGVPAFVELLNASDSPIRTAVVENGRAFFPFLLSGKYYARLIEDANGNGIYDTGDFQTGRQPDLAYYYPKVINIKKNWDKEEVWDLWATPIDQQKPKAVIKNKPKTVKRSKNNNSNDQYDEEEDEDYFDPTENPFEDEQTRRRNRQRRQGLSPLR